MFKKIWPYIITFFSGVVVAGILSACIIGGIISESDKNYELAENRIRALTIRLEQSIARNKEITDAIADAGNTVTGIESGINTGSGRVALALDYNRRIEKILQSAKVLE